MSRTPRGPGAPPPRGTGDRTRLHDLLREVIDRADDAEAAQERLRALLDAVVALSSDLDLPTLLREIVEAGCQLASARYGALGVLDEEGTALEQFVQVGIDEATAKRIGPLPTGHGLLGQLIRDPRPLRLDDVSAHPAAHGYPPHHPPMHSFLGVPVLVRNAPFGNLYLTEKLGATGFSQADEDVVVALAAAAGVAVENARLYDEARRRHAWATAAADLVPHVLATGSTDARLERVAAQAREVAEAELVLVLRDVAADEAVVVAAAGAAGAAGDAADALAGRRVPASGPEGWGGAAPARRLRDVDDDPVLAALVPERPDGTARQPAMVVPLPVGIPGGATLAVVAPPGRRAYSTLSLDLAGGFADQAALALELAAANRDRRRLAVFEDRDRIARDLHDLVIQRLFATGLGLQGLATQLREPAAVDRLKGYVEDLDATIRDIRSAIYSLHAADRAAGTTRAEVEQLLEEVRGPLGGRPRLTVSGPLDAEVHGELAADLVAVVREALSNVARHAQARHVAVEVAVGDGRVQLRVDDDGVGMDPTQGRRSGLANLAQRAAHHDGTLTVEPSPAGGTRLTWTARLP